MAGLAAAALTVWGTAPARADDAQVTVVLAGGGMRTLSLAALAGDEDVVERTYALRSAEGESELTVTGFSLASILDAAGADPYGFSYLEVQRPAGGSVLLSHHQALDPGAFEGGTPVVYATTTGTGFLRPIGGTGDLNAGDCFEAPQGVTLALRNGSPLQVEIEASAARTRVGKPVAFEAVVEGAGAGEQLSYSWYFDDGHSASGPSARHDFARRGSYDVVVGVTTPGDRAGASAVTTVQVGPPLSGPDRKGGGSNRDADAPDHGAATGTRGAVPPGPAGGSSGGDARQREVTAGAVVSGKLVRATRPVDETRPVGARSGQLEEGSASAGVPGEALVLLVVAGLLGLGVLVEARSLLR